MERFNLWLSVAPAIAANSAPARSASKVKRAKRSAEAEQENSLTPESRPMELGATTPKTVEHLMSDVLYAINFAKMNHVLNRRINIVLACVIAVGGALTGATGLGLFNKVEVFNEHAAIWTFGWFVVTAIAAAAKHYGQFGDLAKKYLAARDEFIDLEAKGWDMTAKDLQSAFNRIEKKYPVSGQWLADAAYNRTVVALNHPEQQVTMPRLRAVLAHTL